MALGLYADVGVVDVDEVPERGKVADEHHPATIAFRSAGGNGDVWVRSEIPMGRGLGFSGAVRVGGAVLGVLQSRPAACLDSGNDADGDRRDPRGSRATPTTLRHRCWAVWWERAVVVR